MSLAITSHAIEWVLTNSTGSMDRRFEEVSQRLAHLNIFTRLRIDACPLRKHNLFDPLLTGFCSPSLHGHSPYLCITGVDGMTWNQKNITSVMTTNAVVCYNWNYILSIFYAGTKHTYAMHPDSKWRQFLPFAIFIFFISTIFRQCCHLNYTLFNYRDLLQHENILKYMHK